MYVEHWNDRIAKTTSHNIDFLEDEFSSIDEIKKGLKLYDLQQDL